MSELDVSSLTSYASSLAANAQSTAKTSAISNSVGSVNANSTDDELLDACKQFETYLWEQILKEVDKTTNLFGTDSSGSYAGNMVNTFSDQFIEAISDQITDEGGDNSLAQTLYKQLQRNYSTVTAREIDEASASEAVAESGIVTEGMKEE